MRRVAVDTAAKNKSGEPRLGPEFWLTRAPLPAFVPVAGNHIPLLSQMDAMTQRDADQFSAQSLEGHFPKPPAPMLPSETSLTWQLSGRFRHQHRDLTAAAATSRRAADEKNGQVVEEVVLALLIRDDGHPASLREWASLCTVRAVNRTTLACFAAAMANGELPLLPGEWLAGKHIGACNWSIPRMTSIPDSRAKTCAGVLPASATPAATVGSPAADSSGGREYSGLRYLIGNQLPKVFDRDPLTIALSPDGVTWNWVGAVRGGAPPKRYPGFGKGPGYQYPGNSWRLLCAHQAYM